MAEAAGRVANVVANELDADGLVFGRTQTFEQGAPNGGQARRPSSGAGHW